MGADFFFFNTYIDTLLFSVSVYMYAVHRSLVGYRARVDAWVAGGTRYIIDADVLE